MSARRFTPLVLLPLSACATFVHSDLDDGTRNGLRYSLPVPFLLVTPKPDGTIENSVIYLPDPDATYVLRTKSFISNYTLDVQLENQMLKSVSLSSKADEVASALAEASGNVAKAKIDARTKAEDDSEKADADAAKALAEAELTVQLADAKLKALQKAQAKAEDILAADIEYQQAIMKGDVLRRGQTQRGKALDAANTPEDGQPATARMVAGPMLFRIVQDDTGVKLVAVRGPRTFATSDAVRAALPFTVSPTGTLIVKPDANGSVHFEVKINRTITDKDLSVVVAKASAQAVALTEYAATASVQMDANGSTITVTFGSPPPSGDYVVVLRITPKGAAKRPIEIKIQITK